MRIRTIKPDFWKSEKMASVSDFACKLAIALLNYSDDSGYFLASPALIRGECFPYEDGLSRVESALHELSAIGYIRIGLTEDCKQVGLVVNFLIHQRIDKPQKSKYKDSVQFQEHSKSIPRTFQEHSKNTQGVLKEHSDSHISSVSCDHVLQSDKNDGVFNIDSGRNSEASIESAEIDAISTIPRTFQEHSKNIPRTFQEHSTPVLGKGIGKGYYVSAPEGAETHEKKERKRSTRPTIGECLEYGAELGMSEHDIHHFFDDREAKGWVSGKTPIKDWRAALRTWRRNGWQYAGKSAVAIPPKKVIPANSPPDLSFLDDYSLITP